MVMRMIGCFTRFLISGLEEQDICHHRNDLHLDRLQKFKFIYFFFCIQDLWKTEDEE